MITDTVLTNDERDKFVGDLVGYGTDFVAPLYAVVESIEQAVLQSPEVQRLREDADKYHVLRAAAPLIIDDARKDTALLDWMVEQRAYISNGGKSLPGGFQHGYWLTWPDDDITQRGIFATPRDAIDAAMKEQP